MERIVEGTNDSSTTSKYSMIRAGYIEDPYIKFFVTKAVKRAPLINQIYYVRWVVVSRLIKHFCQNSRDLLVQIVSLGAGFDTTYFRNVSNYNNFRYFEIDLPGVVKNKVGVIKKCQELMDLIAIKKENIAFGNENEYLSSHRYTIFPHDLNKLDGLEMKLKEYGFEFNAPTLVISECALAYLEQETCTSLIDWIEKKFTRSVFAVYEQVYPEDAFGQIMTAHFKKIQSPLGSIHTYKTVQLQIQRFLSCGWHWCEGSIAEDLLPRGTHGCIPDYMTVFCKELFDEYEEWHLANSHYSLIIAAKQEYVPMWNHWLPDSLHIPNYKVGKSLFFNGTDLDQLDINNHLSLDKKNPIINWKIIPELKVERFGHTCLGISDNTFLIFGGFGKEEKKHTRLKSVDHVSLENFSLNSVQVVDQPNGRDPPRWDCMYSTCTKLNDKQFVLYGGRTSPKNPVNDKGWLCNLEWSEANKSGSIVPITQAGKDFIQPPSRWRHTATLISPGKIIICGGLTACLNKVHSLYDAWMLTVYETKRETRLIWSELPEMRSKGFFSHSATAHNETLYISGGLENFLKPVMEVYSYRSDRSPQWRNLKHKDFCPPLRPRFGHTSHVTENNQLLLVGGVNSYPEDQPGLAVVCLKTRKVTEYYLWPLSPEYPVFMAHNHISVYRKKDNSLYIAGGGGNCFSFGTHFNPCVISISISSIELNLLPNELEKLMKLNCLSNIQRKFGESSSDSDHDGISSYFTGNQRKSRKRHFNRKMKIYSFYFQKKKR